MRFILLFISFVITNAHAILHLELTKGLASAIPITLVNDATNPDTKRINDIIQNDLHNSGEFKVTSASSIESAQKNNARFIAQTSVITKDHQLSITLHLLSEDNRTLLNQQFHTTDTGLRVVSHHMSDMIFEKITGIPGIFSTKFAYVLIQRKNHHTHYNLALSDADGLNQKILLTSTQPIMSPSWSSDGKSLLYVSFEWHRSSIFKQNIATGQRTLISQFPGINGAPAFSPDNQLIALVLSTTQNPNLFLLNPSTRQLKQLTKDYGIDTEPAWSHDKKTLYFTSNRAGGPQIYALDLQSMTTQRVSFDGDYNARASVAVDNQSLAMIHREDGKYEIANLDLNSGRLLSLTSGPDDGSPSMAPNGKMILYETKRSGHAVLALVSVDGRVQLTLPAQDGDVQDPAWSPYLS